MSNNSPSGEKDSDNNNDDLDPDTDMDPAPDITLDITENNLPNNDNSEMNEGEDLRQNVMNYEKEQMMEETNKSWNHIIEHGWFVSEDIITSSSS